MSRFVSPPSAKLVLFSFLLFFASASQVFGASVIGGFVYDEQRNPVSEVDVELLNENQSLRDRVRTNGIGRYEFNNVADGRYYVRVLPFRYNLQDDTQEVVVDSFSLLGGGSTYVNQDFYLKRKQGGLGETTNGVLFVQEVPEAAEILYKDGVEALQNGETYKGMQKLAKAIEEFPSYYAASMRLGLELLIAEEYVDAAKLFMRSAEANPKSSKSFYYTAVALNKIGKDYNKAALKAIEKARVLAPASFEVELLFGKILRQEGEFGTSEEHLLKAKKLANVKVPEIHIELAQLYGNDLKIFDKAAEELENYLKASGKKDEKIEKQIQDLRAKAKRNE